MTIRLKHVILIQRVRTEHHFRQDWLEKKKYAKMSLMNEKRKKSKIVKKKKMYACLQFKSLTKVSQLFFTQRN